MINLKLAFRALFRNPFVALVAIVSLGLGIGANAAIFSLYNQLLLRPLPVPQPRQLVNLANPGPKPGSQSCNNAGSCDEVFSYPMFRDLERVQTVFTGIAAHRLFGANLAYRGQTTSGEGMLVSGSYFSVLGIQPALGRLLGPEDDRAIDQSPVAVLSHAYWRSRFNEDPNVLNDVLVVNGQHLTIVGVAPAGFEGTTVGSRPQVFVPITLRGQMAPGFKAFDNRRSYWAYLFARLKPGVSIEEARAQINGPYRAILHEVEAPLQKGMSDQTLTRFKAKELTAAPGARGQSDVHREGKAPLTLLLGVTALVLLIACANIANLLLARSAARAGEMAVRLSIGASRRHLVGQLLTESCMLALAGGAASVLVARWTLHLMVSLLPAEAATVIELHLNGLALVYAAVLTLGTGLLFGLFPALHSTRPDLLSTLKGQAGQPSGAKAASRFRMWLATAQMALSMALLVSAGLFTRSLVNVSRVDLGLDVENLVTLGISPDLNGYTTERAKQLYERLEDELAVPGVTGVTAALVASLAGNNWGSDVAVEGFKAGPDTNSNSRYNEVSPGYFRTMGITLMAGREFTRADTDGSPKVAIVNETFAKKFNLGRDAVGKRIGSGSGYTSALDTEIVGLVQNAKYSQVKGEVPPLFFRPYRQSERVGSMTFYIRTSLDPEQLLGTLPKVVARLDANLPVENLRTMEQQVRENIFIDRFITVLSTAFAGLATLLAAIGLYGVLAYTIAQRTREIGLRMALGAAPGRVRRMVLGQVGRMAVVGGMIGLAGAIAIGRTAQALLFEVEGHDPIVLASASAALALVALSAGFIPAYSASRIDPMRALRYE